MKNTPFYLHIHLLYIKNNPICPLRHLIYISHAPIYSHIHLIYIEHPIISLYTSNLYETHPVYPHIHLIYIKNTLSYAGIVLLRHYLKNSILQTVIQDLRHKLNKEGKNIFQGLNGFFLEVATEKMAVKVALFFFNKVV